QNSLGITIIPLDVYGLFQQIVSNPASFGFTDLADQAKSGGIGVPGQVVPNPDQYLFWDPVHPTAHTQQLIGQAAFEAVTAPEPSTLALLAFGGAALTGWRRWRKR